MVVDHPADTEIFADALPIRRPELRLYAQERHTQSKGHWDDNGSDVTDAVRELDGRYLDTFSQTSGSNEIILSRWN